MFRPASLPRRGLRLEAAATYCGVSPNTFLAAVKAGEIHKGTMWRGCRVWDIKQLDLDLDRIFESSSPSGASKPEADHDEWTPRA